MPMKRLFKFQVAKIRRFSCGTGLYLRSVSKDNAYLVTRSRACLYAIPRVNVPSVNQRFSFSTSTKLQMRFVQFTVSKGQPKLGIQLQPEGDIVDVSGVDHSIPNNLLEFLQKNETEDILTRTKRIVAEARAIVPWSSATVHAPITKPSKVVCIGRNYQEHIDEQKAQTPEEPIFFSKFSSCIVGPHDNISYPSISQALDWEVELAVVIGKSGRNILRKDAYDYVFGYTIAQDITARDWQKRNGGQWMLGKSIDTSCPLGPAVMMKEIVPDITKLKLRCWVNGMLKQEGETSQLINKIDYIISYLSQFFTLLPGDVILTGTPGGVGFARNPPQFLKSGDIVESEITGFGRLKNTVV